MIVQTAVQNAAGKRGQNQHDQSHTSREDRRVRNSRRKNPGGRP
jgi:hypothetical protein